MPKKHSISGYILRIRSIIIPRGVIMKRIFLFLSVFLLVTTASGCHRIRDEIKKFEKQEQEKKHEKFEDSRKILDAIQEEIAKKESELEVVKNVLSDKSTGLAHYEIIPLDKMKQDDKTTKHFKPEDIKDGYVLRPIVTSDNAELLIIVQAKDKKAAESVKSAMGRVLSDQARQVADAKLETRELVKNNKTIRQGNFLIYVTWKHSADIIHTFEQHVR